MQKEIATKANLAKASATANNVGAGFKPAPTENYVDARTAQTDQIGNKLPLLDLRDVNHISLAAVAIKPLTYARVVNDILRQTLADHETNQRLRAVVHRLVRDAARRKADEISRTDFLPRAAHDFGPVTRQHINRLVFIFVRMKFRRFIPRRDRNEVDADILQSDFIANRFIDSYCGRI